MQHIRAAWIEIPVTDIERAKSFYEAVLQTEIQVLDLGVFKMGLLPGGLLALCQHPQAYFPTDTQGILLYLDGGPDLAPILGRVAEAGGQVLRDKTQISPEQGYMALLKDTEGNRIGLRSPH